MKSLIILAVLVLVGLGHVHAGRRPSYGIAQRKDQNLLGKINTTVNLLLQSKVTPAPSSLTSNLSYVWDLIPAPYRFLMLNQSSIKSLGWDVQSLLNVTTRLEWTSLPENVKNAVSQQVASLSFLNTTFSDWNWVNSTNLYANSTLFSILPSTLITILPNLTSLYGQLSLNDVVNITALRVLKIAQYYNSISSTSAESDNLISFDEVLGHSLLKRHLSGSSNVFRRPRDVFQNAYKRAQTLLRSYGIYSARF